MLLALHNFGQLEEHKHTLQLSQHLQLCLLILKSSAVDLIQIGFIAHILPQLTFTGV